MHPSHRIGRGRARTTHRESSGDLHSTLQELKKSEERLRLALEAGSMGTWDWDGATGKISWSGQLERLTGLAPGSFVGDYRSFLRIIHPDDRKFVASAFARGMRLGEPYDLEFRVVWPDGSIRWIAGKGRATRDSHGRVTRALGVGM